MRRWHVGKNKTNKKIKYRMIRWLSFLDISNHQNYELTKYTTIQKLF